jgi:hypothetical protein
MVLVILHGGQENSYVDPRLQYDCRNPLRVVFGVPF